MVLLSGSSLLLLLHQQLICLLFQSGSSYSFILSPRSHSVLPTSGQRRGRHRHQQFHRVENVAFITLTSDFNSVHLTDALSAIGCASSSSPSSSSSSSALLSQQSPQQLPSLDFDFASQSGWDEYYQRLEGEIENNDDDGDDDYKQKEDKVDGTAVAPPPAAVVEWHSSVQLEDLVSLILQYPGDAVHDGNDSDNSSCSILLVGCGNSHLPDVILQQQQNQQQSNQQEEETPSPSRRMRRRRCNRVVLMDTSPTCLQQVHFRLNKNVENDQRHHKKLVGNNNSKGRSCRIDTNTIIVDTNGVIEYVCGDATRLTDYFVAANDEIDDYCNKSNEESSSPLQHPSCQQEQWSHVTNSNVKICGGFDVIVDKGLCDAIWCGEGWNGPLERLFEEVVQVLRRPNLLSSSSSSQSNAVDPQQRSYVSSSSTTGRYILVSYKLSTSNKQFLLEVGKQVGLQWEFDIPPPFSNHRVSVSIATLVTPLL